MHADARLAFKSHFIKALVFLAKLVNTKYCYVILQTQKFFTQDQWPFLQESLNYKNWMSEFQNAKWVISETYYEIYTVHTWYTLETLVCLMLKQILLSLVHQYPLVIFNFLFALKHQKFAIYTWTFPAKDAASHIIMHRISVANSTKIHKIFNFYNQFEISIWSWQPWFQMELNYLQSDLAWHNYRNMICTFCHRNKIPHITWCIHENQKLQPLCYFLPKSSVLFTKMCLP